MAYKKVDTEKGFRNIITCEKDDEIESVTITFRTKNKPFKKSKTNSITYTKGVDDVRIIIEDKPMWGKPIVEDN